MKHSLLWPSLILLLLPDFAFGGPLQEASINQIVNDVKVIDSHRGSRRAVLHEAIKGDLGIATGIDSRAELLFQDRTLTRLGAETFFSFKPGTRDVTLDRGTMLLQVPKGLGGARIRAGSVSASITGTTIMVQHLPQKRVKVLVLEGSLRLAMNNRSGESVLLTPGRMVSMDPKAKRVPEPVALDLRQFVKSSSLIDPRGFKGKSDASPAPLPSMGLIKTEIAHQETRRPEQSTVSMTTQSATQRRDPSLDVQKAALPAESAAPKAGGSDRESKGVTSASPKGQKSVGGKTKSTKSEADKASKKSREKKSREADKAPKAAKSK